MKLRNKVSVILFLLWCVIISVAYLGSQLILSKSYLDIESSHTKVNLQRINEAIDQTTSALATLLATWAIWDDTYQFVTDLNHQYIKKNMVIGSFASMNIDDMLFYDAAGKPIYTMAVDASRTKKIAVSPDLLDYLKPLIQQRKNVQGLAATPSGLKLIVTKRIMTTSNTGPAHGTMVMVKDLSKIEIDKIMELTKVNLAILPLTEMQNTAALNNVYHALLANNNTFIDRSSENTLVNYSLLNDINGNPAAMLKFTMPRTAYHFGLNTLLYYNSIFIIYSILLMGLLWYLLQKLLVERLEKLRVQIGDFDDNNHYFNNLISGYADEVSSVASLYHQATHDPLTGLANRNLLDQAFTNNVIKASANKSKIALLFMDIDYFKRVNDTLGHEIGDELLIEVAKKLSACLREHDLAVRLGGDEFVVMLVDIDVQQIKPIVERIYNTLADTIIIKDHELHITSSMGISIWPDNGNDIAAILKNADIALYHAKESGRNHYQYYSAELNKAIQEAYKKEAELQSAINNNEFCLFYQPIFDVLTKRIISMEALIRWRHPERGLLGAGEIIPLADKSGLIVQIGLWVLTTACRQAKAWHMQGLPLIPVAVNISLLQAKNTSIYQQVSAVLLETGLDPHLLELELTETSYVEITESILNDLRLLKSKGVKLVVDDFGVGYSGLGYLRSLPVCKLKIDQSFIKDVICDPDDCSITLAIIAIAHQLDLQVIAEGVESLDHLNFLKMHHVDAVQGNYLSPPLDVIKCEKLLAELQEIISHSDSQA